MTKKQKGGVSIFFELKCSNFSPGYYRCKINELFTVKENVDTSRLTKDAIVYLDHFFFQNIVILKHKLREQMLINFYIIK